MSGLFKKFNTLVKATINDALDVSTRSSGEFKPGRKLDQDVKRLRERINDAIDHEDTLEARVAALQEDEDRLDAAANAAVERGDNAAARDAIKQLAVVRKQREMTEADLRQHRHVAEELIRQVNMMEAAAADAKRDNSVTTEPPQPPKRVNIPVQGAGVTPSAQKRVDVPVTDNTPTDAPADEDNMPDAAQGAVDRARKAFDDAQSRISQLQDQLNSRGESTPPAPGADATPSANVGPSDAEVDDELNKRVSRLSKRPPKPDA